MMLFCLGTIIGLFAGLICGYVEACAWMREKYNLPRNRKKGD